VTEQVELNKGVGSEHKVKERKRKKGKESVNPIIFIALECKKRDVFINSVYRDDSNSTKCLLLLLSPALSIII